MSASGIRLGNDVVMIPVLPSAVSFYLGDTARRAAAKPLTVAAGQEAWAADIMVPLSKLHSLSGTVVAKSDGHRLNTASVVLEDVSMGVRSTRHG
jgi:hypothetical protein